jgi:integrase
VARGINRLTGADLRRSKKGKYPDGDGLYLQVTPSKGGKFVNRSWLFRRVVNGRERWMGLGSLNTVSLVEARERARQCRLMVLDGIDPIEAREQRRAQEAAASKRVISFDECAAAYIAAKRNEWRSQKHAATWPATIRKYVSPAIGKLPVDVIDTALIMKVLQPIWDRIPESASRLRGRIESILDWATVSGFRHGENPAAWKGRLEHLLAAPRKVKPKENMAAMPYSAVPAFTARLRAEQGMSARALEFLVLTAARAGEVRGAVWSEFDLNHAVWEIPGHRMKAGKPHRVPLPSRCIEILRAMPRQGDLVFPGRAGGMMADSNLVYLLRKLGHGDVTVHGMRSAFRDWAAEQTAFPHEVCEAALAHSVHSAVVRAYKRTDLFDRRRKLMQVWADYCSRSAAAGATVTTLRARADA